MSRKHFLQEKTTTEIMTYNADMREGRPTTRKAPAFGERLSSLRREQGLSQTAFARKAGISRQMVEYYERRSQNPSAEFVRTAAVVLRVSSDQLLGIQPIPKTQPGRKSQVELRLEKVKDLPRGEQQYVVKFLDQVLARYSLT